MQTDTCRAEITQLEYLFLQIIKFANITFLEVRFFSEMYNIIDEVDS